MSRAVAVNLIRVILLLVIFGLGMLSSYLLFVPKTVTDKAVQSESQKVGNIQSEPENAQVEEAQKKEKDKLYTVEQGDTAVAIAKQFGVSLKVIKDANPHIRNIAKIRPGTTILIPVTPASPTTDTQAN